MIPRIRKAKDWETKFGTWATYNDKHCDLCESLGDAIRFWFWYCGVNPKIAFFTLKRWRNRLK